MKYVPVAGTWGRRDSWVIDDDDALTKMFARNGLTPARLPNGDAWDWDSALSGLPFQGTRGWTLASHSLESFAALLNYRDRNFIAHSHGGQVVLMMAARGIRVRSLTTVGTPRRYDVPAEEAATYIGYWQHICDARWDLIGTLRRRLGALGDKHMAVDRRFIIPGVINRQLKGISHSKILRDPSCFHLWEESGWIDGILFGAERRKLASDSKPAARP